MRVQTLTCVALSLIGAAVSAAPVVIARDSVPDLLWRNPDTEAPPWRREAEAEAGTDGAPGWRREAEPAAPGWRREAEPIPEMRRESRPAPPW